MDTATSVRDLLFTLLLKVAVASSIAALLARWNTFRRVLFTEERDPDQKLKLMLFMTPPLIVGVTLRLVGYPYRFADLSLEGAFLMGLLGGRVVGPIGGAIITIPALISHEWLAMPAAFTVPTGRAHWETLLRARAIENLCYVVAPAQSGTHSSGRETYGDSLIVDYWGQVLSRLAKGTGVITADIDLAKEAETRARFPALDNRQLGLPNVAAVLT